MSVRGGSPAVVIVLDYSLGHMIKAILSDHSLSFKLLIYKKLHDLDILNLYIEWS